MISCGEVLVNCVSLFSSTLLPDVFSRKISEEKILREEKSCVQEQGGPVLLNWAPLATAMKFACLTHSGMDASKTIPTFGIVALFPAVEIVPSIPDYFE